MVTIVNKSRVIYCRKVDDLGRIVIPKEIRRTLRIRERDPSHTISQQNGVV